MQTYRFYLVTEDGSVESTNDFDIAAVAKRDGTTLVLEPKTGEYTFDGDVQMVEAADEADWLDPDLEDDEDDEDKKEAP